MRWLDAALVAVAATVTSFTYTLAGSDYPAAFIPKFGDVRPEGRCIVLVGSAHAAESAYVVGPRGTMSNAAKRNPKRITVSTCIADRAALVDVLAQICRAERIPAERIVDPHGVGGSKLAADVARALLRG